MKSVEDLDVFKMAHELALKTYATTKKLPREETFSLVDQTRRAVSSVGMNLMEGAMRLGSKVYPFAFILLRSSFCLSTSLRLYP